MYVYFKNNTNNQQKFKHNKYNILYCFQSASGTAELVQELEAARRLVKTLHEYLDNLRVFRKSLKDVNKNCEQLKKVNLQWIEIANIVNES